MKISLPNTRSSKGFTLIELLIVVTILGVLALISVAAFRGFANRGNDEKRNADLNAIAQVLELNKTAAGYQSLAGSQFASGNIPTDPDTANKTYCIASTTAANPTVPANPTTLTMTATTCTGSVIFVGTTAVNFVPVSTASTPASNTTAWKVCGLLQAGTIVCRNSAQ